MPLPTPAKTWLISPNNTLTSNTTTTDSYGRGRDIADFWGVVVQRLLSLSSNSITVRGSSDGTTNISPITMNGVNLWTNASTNLRSGVLGGFTTTTVNSVWIVLRFGTGGPELALSFVGGSSSPVPSFPNRRFVAYYSPSGAFIAPANSQSRPTATDEVLIFGRGNGFSNNGVDWYNNPQTAGVYNQNNLGIINTSNSYANYTQQVHVGLASDLSGFYAVSYRAQVPALMVWFGTLQNAITNSGSFNWSTAKVFFMSGDQTFAQFGGIYNQGWNIGYQARSNLDTAGVLFMPAAIPNLSGSTAAGNFETVALNSIMFNGSGVDLDTNEFPISPISLYSPVRFGLKGILTDLWFGPSGGNTYTYPSSAPTAPNFFQANNFIFPWDGATQILFA